MRMSEYEIKFRNLEYYLDALEVSEGDVSVLKNKFIKTSKEYIQALTTSMYRPSNARLISLQEMLLRAINGKKFTNEEKSKITRLKSALDSYLVDTVNLFGLTN